MTHNEERILNLEHNRNFVEEIMNITDNYLRQKLVDGYCKYEPMLWSEAQLDPMDENSLDTGYDMEEGRD